MTILIDADACPVTRIAENIDGLLMERHLAKKARRSGKDHLKSPAKRTEEDDRRFAESLERMIREAMGEEKQI